MVEDRGPQMLKGVREPVTPHRVVQPREVRSRLDVAAGRLSRFVGRDIELASLVDRWERAQDGEGQNVVVLGESGLAFAPEDTAAEQLGKLEVGLTAKPGSAMRVRVDSRPGARPFSSGTTPGVVTLDVKHAARYGHPS